MTLNTRFNKFFEDLSGERMSEVTRESSELVRDSFIEFCLSHYIVCHGCKTGFELILGPDRKMTWTEAENWLKTLPPDIYGKGWRFPTMEELNWFYENCHNRVNKMDSFWSGEKQDSENVFGFNFRDGKKFVAHIKNCNVRAVAVRCVKLEE